MGKVKATGMTPREAAVNLEETLDYLEAQCRLRMLDCGVAEAEWYDVVRDNVAFPAKWKPARREQAKQARMAIEFIYVLRLAIARGDAIGAARNALSLGGAIVRTGFARLLWLGEMEEKKIASLAGPHWAEGQENKQAVLAARSTIINANPNIRAKALMGRIKEATGLKERAIYNHLSSKGKKITARR
jgi:hypothetical protein